MKKTLLALTLSITGLTFSHAQITITQTEMPVAGDTIFEAEDTIPPVSLTIGSAGADQSWDFSSLESDEMDTTYFLDPAATPYGSDFPGSNLTVFDISDSFYVYINSTPTSVELLGFAGDIFGTGSAISLVLDDPQTFLNFPTEYESTFTDHSSRSTTLPNPGFLPQNFDSMRIVNNTTVVDTIDGWGTATTPMGDYDVLRQKTIEYKVDTMLARDTLTGWTPIDTTLDTSYSYSWLAKGVKLSVVDVDMDSSGTNITGAKYSMTPPPPPPSGIEKESPIPAVMDVYPNPFAELTRVRFYLPKSGHTTIQVYDLLGQEARVLLDKSLPAGQHTAWFKATGLPSGVYLLKLSTPESAKTVKLQVVK